jgi:immune inhibitor A
VRRIGLLVSAFLLAVTSVAAAAPPIFSVNDVAARKGPDAAARYRSGLAARKPAGVDRAVRTTQASGDYRALVILLDFADNPADSLNHPPSAYANLLFSQGTHPTGSMRDYFQEVSRGAFDISGVVTRWYRAPRDYAEYSNGLGGFGGVPNNAQQMAADAVLLADADHDLGDFDNDGPDGIPDSGDDDGMIDALFIVHAGPGGEETADFNDIWSHQWNLPAAYASPDGVAAFLYTTEPEEWAGAAPFTAPDALISVGVFCHEFGHVLGLPDLYDTSNTLDAHEGVGEWDLMGSGLYNHLDGDALGSKPGHFSAWSLARLEWVTPVWVTADSLGAAIPPVETSDRVFRLWTNGEEAAEYFLIENRQPIGFDAGLVRSSVEAGDGPAHGLLIYHVDESVIGQEDETHKLLDVEEAGGVRIPSGFIGEQNLDASDGLTVFQTICGGTVNVVGNRGDNYDPWPGEGNQTDFEGASCPSTDSYCGGRPSQVAVRNISETSGTVTADILVTGLLVHRGAPVADDPPMDGTPNNGNGFLETGETARIRIPVTNLGPGTIGPLVARLESTEPYLALVSDSLVYGSFASGAVDSGSAAFALVTSAPDPSGSMLAVRLRSSVNEILADSVAVPLGLRTGVCENFEGGATRWYGVPTGCDGIDEWHREQGLNSTPGGAWAWRLGPSGLIGSYALSQDARLVSPPIRLEGPADTLRFRQRYDCELFFDGLSVEITTDAGGSWTPLVPVGGYPTGDRYSGTSPDFTEAVFALDGYAGIVQIAFRFRAQPPNGGLGWWIDDVAVNGDAPCVPVDAAVDRFQAFEVAGTSPPRVRVAWTLPGGVSGTVSIDRAVPPAPPVTILRLPGSHGEGAVDDPDVTAGGTYDYTLRLSRPGQPDAVAGPVRVNVAPAGAPRAFAFAPVRPNPFRATGAGLLVSLDRDGPFVVRIYRVDGAAVRTLRYPARPAGTHAITWDGRDETGRPAAAGLYFFELRFGARTSVQKAVLLR